MPHAVNTRLAIVWAALALILVAVGLPGILAGVFPDPDDTLRLVQVRDLLAGQGWWDLHQYRIDAPSGTLMHWSRLVDTPLALVIAAFTPLFGQGAAETIALILVPLLTLGAVLFVVGRLAARLFDLEVATMACLALAFLAPLVVQLQPMRIDHHGWQVLSVAIALSAAFDTKAWRGGQIAGLAMAVGANISLETIPMAAVFGAVFALRWWRDGEQRWWLASYMAALAVGMAAVFLATRGLSDLAQHCDAISTAHLAFFAIAAAGTCALALVGNVPRYAVVAGLAISGIAGLLVFGTVSPGCLQSPFAALDPLVRDYWYINVKEGRPVWEQSLRLAGPVVFQLFVALGVTLRLMRRNDSRVWFDYAIILAGSIVLTLFVWRSSAFASVIALVPLGWLLSRLRLRLTRPNMRQKLLAAVLFAAVLLPSLPATLSAPFIDTRSKSTDAPVIRVADSGCGIADNAVLLRSLPSGTIFAPLDIGPDILLDSGHSVVATGHHRAADAMRDVIATYTGTTQNARASLARYDARYVVMCSDLAEPWLFKQRNPASFAADLMNGDPPDWLARLDVGGPPELLVYRTER
ncbi:MAG: hypothetical protein WA954_10455 [Parerythrobacter sp.]